MLRARNSNTMGFRSKNKSFVIGFVDDNLASIAARHVGYDSKMFMREVAFQDIRQEMNELEPDMQNVPIQKLLMDTNCKLVVEKKIKPGKLKKQVTQSEEFLMYPVTKNIGVVIAESIAEETAQHLIFDIHVIAPTFTPEMFEP